MSAPAILVVTLIYLYVALNEFLKKDYGQAVIWTGYSIANVGFIMGFMK